MTSSQIPPDAPLSQPHLVADAMMAQQRIRVLVMLVASGAVMAAAWLAHLRFEGTWSFATALAVSWSMVLPEYALNTHATRTGKRNGLTGAQMASVHLSSGVVFIALISVTVLDEAMSLAQGCGLVLMLMAIFLILGPTESKAVPQIQTQANEDHEDGPRLVA